MAVRSDDIPAEIRAIPRWVLWSWTWNEKSSKWDKPPLTMSGRNASSTNPKTWTTFTAACTYAPMRDGIGFVLGGDVEIVGIDLDDCRDPVTCAIHEPAASIIKRVDSYSEVSPSGTGVKVFVKATLPKKCRKANHDVGVEVYDSGRYFTVTGHRVDGTPATINERQAEVKWLLDTWVKPQPKMRNPSGVRGDDIEIARSALAALRGERADGYDDWLRVGMALKSVTDSLLPDWDSWSRQSPKYAEGVCAEKWPSFNRHGVGIGTLIQWAREDGWKPPKGTKASATLSVEDAIAALAEGPMRLVVTNGVRAEEEQEDGSVKEKLVALSMLEIIERTQRQTNNWPRRVDDVLFVHDAKYGVSYLEKPQSLFGWLHSSVNRVQWYGGTSVVKQTEFFAELQRTATSYENVEAYPHHPPLPKHYYAYSTPEAGYANS
jgi:hypothetical protein